MKRLWSFLEVKKNREIAAWVGGGLTVVVAGLWTAFIYFADKPKPNPPSIQASCGSIAVGGNVTGSPITAGSTANCPERKS